ncbi:sensor histidine kinase [Planomonospora corallina]|uniref:histidine kinase n=1 Tax=Planomonospora corallina TaxID=1806052 RepID=A0ABV8I919_9ACTN
MPRRVVGAVVLDLPRPNPAVALLTSPRKLAAVASAVLSVGLIATAVVVYGGLPPVWARDPILSPGLAAGLTFPLVGAFLLVHDARPVTGRLMCAGGLIYSAGVLSTVMMLHAASAGELTAAACLRWAGVVGEGLGGLLLAVLLPLHSPDGRLPSARWRPVAVLAVVVMTAQAAVRVLRPAPRPDGYPYPQVIPNPLAVEALRPVHHPLQDALAGAVSVLVAATVLSLVLRLRRADPAGRRQIAWPLTAFAVYTCFLIAGPDWWLAASVSVGLIPVAIAFAVLRYRLYGIDTVISRAFVAAGLVAAVSVVYFGVGALAGLALSDYDRIGGLAAALFAGAFFHPLRRLLRRLVDRLMYGTHGDPAVLAARLAREVGQAEPAGALAAVASVIRDGLGVTGVTVEVRGPGPRTATVGLPGPSPRAVPLVWHGEPVGRLLLGPPGPRRFAAAHNERLIAVATPYAADVAHAVRMTADLQRSRERILSAREEERRRLRRDLHDGLGHALTDMAMSINMARISLRTAPASADRLLLELRSGMDSVSQEIRELVYGLRPPALDELGLAGAIRALAAEAGPPVTVEASGDLVELPAAVEVAAYRIAQEALTNVRKHARASGATVRLGREDAALVVRVGDDGCGLPEAARSGIGLVSMRERAAELGGSCAVGPGPDGGTVVEAVLPLPR